MSGYISQEDGGKTRIIEEVGHFTGAAMFTVEYQPPKDHPGYPKWERLVTTHDKDRARILAWYAK